MMPKMMAGNQQQGGQQKGDVEFEDLEPYIDKTQIQCLNQDPNFPLDSALFDKSRNIYLKSDCDEQLVIQIGFNAPVRIHHIQFRVPDEKSAPDRIKLFVNQQSLDFENCENGAAVQEIDLKDADFKGQTDLRYVKFQNIKNLTIFVQSNRGDDIIWLTHSRNQYEQLEEIRVMLSQQQSQPTQNFLMIVLLQTLIGQQGLKATEDSPILQIYHILLLQFDISKILYEYQVTWISLSLIPNNNKNKNIC